MGTMGQTSRWDRVGDRGRQTRTDMNTHKQGQPGSGATTHREKTSYPDEEGETFLMVLSTALVSPDPALPASPTWAIWKTPLGFHKAVPLVTEPSVNWFLGLKTLEPNHYGLASIQARKHPTQESPSPGFNHQKTRKRRSGNGSVCSPLGAGVELCNPGSGP